MPNSPLPNEFKSSAGIVMIRVPSGSFTMGSPKSELGHQPCEEQRHVAFLNDFYLAKTPVTQEQYQSLSGANPTRHEKIGDAPVDSVTWEQTAEYCRKLTKFDRDSGALPDDWEYRLPTEAEWEYACRAGSSEPWHSSLHDVAWHYDNSGQRPRPVGQKMPNAWGFHDMLGNLWEGCQDWFSNGIRSGRGGSYFNSALFCRCAQRWIWWPCRYCGFRVLAARAGSLHLSPPVGRLARLWPIYDAIDANDFEVASRIVAADPAAVESPDAIPPPLEYCGDADKPEWVEWLLDHGANIERPNQDYGSTPLTCAVIRRQKRIIQALVKRGADAAKAMHHARRGLSGDFENQTVHDPVTRSEIPLDRAGYQEIVELLQALGIK